MSILDKIITDPAKSDWEKICERPTEVTPDVSSVVQAVLEQVKARGDQALFEYTEKFDGCKLSNLLVSEAELAACTDEVSPELQAAIELAIRNIGKFHAAQKPAQRIAVETMPGVKCWQESRPIEKVGFYIPAGTAPLFSTLLMLAVPGKLAGCKEVVLCTPPRKDGTVNPVILFAAKAAGLNRIFKVGGAQAIAALAFGTETIPKVHKIFGPGNQYVNTAKQMVSAFGTAIDLPAGPTELAILADKSADPDFIAADVLSQAEHGADSQVLIVSNDFELLQNAQAAVLLQLESLPRRSIAEQALKYSRWVQVANLETGVELVNLYGAEHLIISTDQPQQQANQITSAGSVFLGKYSPESVGDYASGTNHILPTHGAAHAWSGVTMSSFYKQISFQQLTAAGLQNLGPAVELMAAAEELVGHQRAVAVRREKLA